MSDNAPKTCRPIVQGIGVEGFQAFSLGLFYWICPTRAVTPGNDDFVPIEIFC